MLNTELKNRIESIIDSNNLVLFMKGTKEHPQCGFSATVVQILNQISPDFTTVNVLEDNEIREGIKAFSAWPTIPQLYANKEFIGGCDIVQALFENGEIFEALKLGSLDVKTPEVSITQSALEAFQKALNDAGEDEKIRIRFNTSFEPDMSFTKQQKNDRIVNKAGVTLLFDPISASRACGITIDFTSNSMSSGFEIKNPNMPPAVKELTASELKQKLDSNEKFHLFDVRTQDEWEVSKIPGARLLSAVSQTELDALDKSTMIVFHCRSGKRSMDMANKFRQQGFTNLYNLKGGILAYEEYLD